MRRAGWLWWPLVLIVLLLARQASGMGLRTASPTTATIVVSPRCSQQCRSAARLLQDYIKQSTGVRFPIEEGNQATRQPGNQATRQPGNQATRQQGNEANRQSSLVLHVGRSAYVDGLDLGLEGLGADGFVLKLIDDRNYVIVGPTDWGTEFGVCEFLERFLGVRWLLPGPHGTDVPKHRWLSLSRQEIRQEPQYWSRQLMGLRGTAETTWARRNRMHGRLNFHHNLVNLFPPDQYAKTHPHFFPISGGKRYVPKSPHDYDWQPDFTAPGLVEEAVRNIRRYFREHPEEMSFSLGINDSGRFDESRESLQRESGRLNLFNCRDVSESYYQWCNQVVAEVLKEFPDKYFGCLAYRNVAEPPRRIRLHPRIIPYLTQDRMMWIDPQLEAAGHAWTERWAACATTLGWYDYAYGAPYCLPRMYMHHMAEYLRYGRDHGVGVHNAELCPNWGEGPKPYVYLKLQWNPDLDLHALLTEWYTRCVGPEAAPLLKEYYDIWERFWTVDVPKSEWFSGRGPYLPFNLPFYLEEVRADDVRRSRELLDACVDKAATAPQRARARLLREAFAYYEASALAYGARAAARAGPLSTEAEALAGVDDAARRLEMAARRIELTRRHRDHEFLGVSVDIEAYPWLRGEDWGVGLFWRLYDWAGRSPAVRTRISTLTSHECVRVRVQARRLLSLLNGPGECLSTNQSFEEGGLAGWAIEVENRVGSVRRVSDRARTGIHSVLCEGVQYGGVYRELPPIQPGRYVAIGYAYVPQQQHAPCTVKFVAIMRNTDDVDILKTDMELVPVPGRWTPIVLPIDVPATANGERVARVLLWVGVRGCQGGKVYLDDVVFCRFPD